MLSICHWVVWHWCRGSILAGTSATWSLNFIACFWLRSYQIRHLLILYLLVICICYQVLFQTKFRRKWLTITVWIWNCYWIANTLACLSPSAVASWQTGFLIFKILRLWHRVYFIIGFVLAILVIHPKLGLGSHLFHLLQGHMLLTMNWIAILIRHACSLWYELLLWASCSIYISIQCVLIAHLSTAVHIHIWKG